MLWATSLLLGAYIGVCEWRAPHHAWEACESRWSVALGVLVPSPVVPLAHGLTARLPAPGGRRRSDALPDEQTAPEPPQPPEETP